MKVCIIGLGEVGSMTFTHFVSKASTFNDLTITGVDINEDTLKRLQQRLPEYSFELSSIIPKTSFDYYILCVYTTDQIHNVLETIATNGTLQGSTVIIESTVMPGTYMAIKEKYSDIDFKLVLFPHRFNPNDPAHEGFNLARIMGE